MLFSFVDALKLINIPLWVVNKMSKDQKIFPNLKKTQTKASLVQMYKDSVCRVKNGPAFQSNNVIGHPAHQTLQFVIFFFGAT